MGGDVLIEPAIEQHVADGGAHGDQVEAEERQTVEPGATKIRNKFFITCFVMNWETFCKNIFYTYKCFIIYFALFVWMIKNKCIKEIC